MLFGHIISTMLSKLLLTNLTSEYVFISLLYVCNWIICFYKRCFFFWSNFHKHILFITYFSFLFIYINLLLFLPTMSCIISSWISTNVLYCNVSIFVLFHQCYWFFAYHSEEFCIKFHSLEKILVCLEFFVVVGLFL